MSYWPRPLVVIRRFGAKYAHVNGELEVNRSITSDISLKTNLKHDWAEKDIIFFQSGFD